MCLQPELSPIPDAREHTGAVSFLTRTQRGCRVPAAVCHTSIELLANIRGSKNWALHIIPVAYKETRSSLRQTAKDGEFEGEAQVVQATC
jgi:hypothetical protein